MADVKSLRLGQRMPIANPSLSNHALDATTDGVGWVFQSPDATAITHIGFRYGSRTGTPPTYVATLEGIDGSTGNPDGSDKGGGSPTAATFTPPADGTWDGTWQWVALSNSYTPSRGEILVPTIRYSSGTVDGSNNSTITTHATSIAIGTGHSFPGAYRLTAGTWAKQNVFPVCGLRTASTRFGYPLTGIYITRSASTVGHRQAMKFTLPAGMGDTFTLRGFRFAGSLASAAGKNPKIGLWSAGGVIQDFTLDSDWVQFASTTYINYEFLFDESSLTSLSFGTAYYLGLEVADATSGGVVLSGFQLDASDDLDAYPGSTDFHFATFDGSSWSDDQTVRPFVEPIFGDITEPAGGGGTVIIPKRRITR